MGVKETKKTFQEFNYEYKEKVEKSENKVFCVFFRWEELSIFKAKRKCYFEKKVTERISNS